MHTIQQKLQVIFFVENGKMKKDDRIRQDNIINTVNSLQYIFVKKSIREEHSVDNRHCWKMEIRE